MKKTYFLNVCLFLFTIFSMNGQQIDPQDKDILISLYNATNGPDWENSWDLDGDAINWHGVILDTDGKVTTLNLNSNNLKGVLPTELEGLDKLVDVGLAGNLLSGKLPNFSGLINLEKLGIGSNNFKFEDFEDQYDQLTGLPSFFYSPQYSICPTLTTRLLVGERKTLTAGSDSPSNIYRWTKNGEDITTATGKTYTIDSMTANDQGVYECIITNSKVLDLELTQGENNIVVSNNLIKNAGFEDWFEFFGRNNLTNWFAGIEPNNTLTNLTQVVDATQGKYAAKAQTNRVNTDGKNFGRLVIDSNQRFTLESGKTYQITYDYKVASGNITSIISKLIDGGLIENEDIVTDIQSSEWQSHSYSFTANSTSEFYDFEITFESDNATGEIILDNVFIVEESDIKPNITRLEDYYTFSESVGTYEPISETDADRVDVPSGTTFSQQSIPFDFVYAGQNVTIFNFVNDPQIVFGSTSGLVTNNLSEIRKNMIAPLKDNTNIGTDTKILFKTIGTAPNRVFIVEFKNAYWSENQISGAINVQIRLEETTNNISFVYGSISETISERMASIGLIGEFGEESSFLSVTPGSPSTVSPTEVNQSITKNQFPPEGTIYTFSYINELQCQRPSSIGASETKSDTKMLITWSKPAFSDKHTLYVRKRTTNADTMSFVTSQDNYLVTGLEPDTSYEAWVINNCSPEQFSLPSPIRLFRTPPSCRTPLFPTSNIQKNSITVEWDTNGSETMWDVAIRIDKDDFSNFEASEITTINAPSHIFQNLIEDTEYRAYYRANCGQGEVSGWISRLYTTLSDCPRPKDLRSVITSSTTADVSWSPRGSETSWEVLVREEGLGEPEPTVNGVVVTSPNYQVIDINNTKIFKYYVRAVCSATEKSAWAQKIITEELQSERELLIAFYNTTDGSNWRNNSNWNTDNPLSSWQGVFVRNGRVVNLSLSNNGLKNTLPEELFELSELEVLYLNNNNLAGEIPSSISKLKKLQVLSLSGNSFTGNIPVQIGELTELSSLSLLRNKFEGDFPESLSNLSKLEDLWLESSNASEIPASFLNLSKLTGLSIFDSNLRGTVPSFLSQFPSLKTLNLGNNEFEGEIPIELLSSTTLKNLDLENNNLSGEVLHNLPASNNVLESLNLNSNNFVGSIPKEIVQLTNLQYIILSNNDLAGKIPVEIAQLPLRTLNLESNNLSGTIPEELSNNINLSILKIGSNSFNFQNLEAFLALNPKIEGFDYSPQTIEAEEITINKLTGESIILTTVLEGSNNSYQWYKNNTLIDGATSKSFEIVSATLDNSAAYYCLVSNSLFTFSLTNENFVVIVEILDLDNDGVDDAVDQCLDTIPGVVVDANGCEIFTLPADNFTIEITGESCVTSDNGSVEITSANTGIALLATVTGNGVTKEEAFTSSTKIEDLTNGSYELCLTIPDETSYKQCYTVIIEEPENLKVFSKISRANKTVSLELSGGSTYYIEVNGLQFSTTNSVVPIALDQNKNVIKVATDKNCQGSFEKTIYLSEEMSMFPNPFAEVLNINLGLQGEKETKVDIYTFSGVLVYSDVYKPSSQDPKIDTSKLAIGAYIISVTTDSTQSNFKIVKR